MEEYLKELFEELNKSDIRYAVLRGYETLPSEVNHDIDLGVHPDDSMKMSEIIQDVSHKYKYETVYTSQRQGIEQLYLFGNTECIKIDIWTMFSYKGLEYLNIKTLLNDIRMHNNIKILAEESEVILSFLKEFLHCKWIRDDKVNLLNLKINKFKNFNNTYEYISDQDLNLFKHYIVEQILSLNSESKTFIKRLFIKNIKNKGFFSTIFSILRYLKSFTKDYLKTKSFFVVLIGPDGSGKTTIANSLIEEIKEKKSCFTKSYYLHGRFGILPDLSSIFGKKGRDVKEIRFGIEENKEIKPHSSLRITIYMVYYFFDFLLGQLKLNYLKYTNTCIVADRYFHDYFYQEHFVNYPKVFRFIYFKILPQPDLVLFLDANPEEIHKRKPELTVSRIQAQQKNIKQLFNYIDNITSVNTSQSLMETVNAVKTIVNTKR